MDTRTKIVSNQQAREMLRGRPARWVSGYFDPLLAEHVRRLHKYAQPGELLVVEIVNPLAPLLAQQARAELVAALAMVDYVVLGTDEPAAQVLDSGITSEFVEHVVNRHRGEGA